MFGGHDRGGASEVIALAADGVIRSRYHMWSPGILFMCAGFMRAGGFSQGGTNCKRDGVFGF